MPVTMHLRQAILAACAGLFVFSPIAVARGPDAMTNQVSTVRLTPPSVIEDNRAVTERLLAHPIRQIWAMPTLREDHLGRPVVCSAFIDIRESMTEAHENQFGPRGVEGGWNCGGTNGIYPPDPIMAAGPAHLIVATNEQFKIYTKEGTEEFVSTWGAFFSDVKPPGTFTTDPKVIYDHDSGRWFLLILAINSGDLYSYYLLAVSDDSDPNGTWMKYALESTLNGEDPSNNWSDYPGLGACADAIYITSNMFHRFTGSLQYAKIRVLPKQQLLDFETTLTWSDIWDIADPGGGTAFTIQPAQHWGTPPVPFLVDSNPDNQISVFGVNDPLGSPTLTSLSATVNNFADPPSAEQLGGLPDLDTIDTRVYNAVWRNDYIYFAHNRNRVNNAGSKWYKVSTADWPASLTVAAEGSVGDNTVNMWFPSVAVNQNDTLVVGFSHSSTSAYASIYYAFRPADGSMSDPLYIHYGSGHYTGSGYSLERWGDYTGTVVDPEDDISFWHYNEFPNPVNSTKWRTWVAKFTADDDCDAPGFTVQPEPTQTICLGQDASLHVEVDQPTAELQWRIGTTDLVDDGHIFGSTTETLYIYNITLDDQSSNYNCKATNVEGGGCYAISDNAEILVDPDVPVIYAHPEDQEVTEGDPVLFTISVQDPILQEFQWRKDEQSLVDDDQITGATTSMLYINPTELGDAGLYDCVVTADLGEGCSITSDAATLVVNPSGGCPNPGGSGNYCTADIDGSSDCIVALNDLAQLVGHYGITTGAVHDDGDLDGDGDVDLSDLAALLGQYGDDCN